jgi:hypothetical protein
MRYWLNVYRSGFVYSNLRFYTAWAKSGRSRANYIRPQESPHKTALMSTTYDSTTFSVPLDQAPDDFSSHEGVESFLSTFCSRSLEQQREIRHPQRLGNASLTLHGVTRSGWCQWAIDNLIAPCGAPGLAFLTRREADWRVDFEEGYYLVSYLDAPKIALAVEGIQRVFAWAELNPLILAGLLPGYEIRPDYSEKDRRKYELDIEKIMLDAVLDEIISVRPHRDVPYAEDGTGPEYLFAFLRTMLVIMQVAAERREIVAHIQVLPS